MTPERIPEVAFFAVFLICFALMTGAALMTSAKGDPCMARYIQGQSTTESEGVFRHEKGVPVCVVTRGPK